MGDASSGGTPPTDILTPRALARLALLLLACFVGVLGSATFMGWCREQIGSFDPISQRRMCGAPPAAVQDWSYTHRTRQPTDRANLEQWLKRHPDRVNNRYNASCDTPLHTAAWFGRDDLAALLLAHGADATALNGNGQTPLHLAAYYGHPNVTAVLLDHGVNPDIRSKEGKTALHQAAFAATVRGATPERLATMKTLLAHRADVNARERISGWTPLRYLIGPGGPPEQWKALVDLLLAAGADTGARDVQGDSLLIRAAFGRDRTLVADVLARDVDVNAPGRDVTALGAAAMSGDVEIVRLLLAHGADPNRQVDQSRFPWLGAPLAMALVMPRQAAPGADGASGRRQGSGDRLTVAQALIDAGADIAIRNRLGEGLVHEAARRGDVEALDFLLARGAGANTADNNGSTPLHAAVEAGHIEAARSLLRKGADVHKKTHSGRTPLDAAMGDPEMVELLRAHGGR